MHRNFLKLHILLFFCTRCSNKNFLKSGNFLKTGISDINVLSKWELWRRIMIRCNKQITKRFSVGVLLCIIYNFLSMSCLSETVQYYACMCMQPQRGGTPYSKWQGSASAVFTVGAFQVNCTLVNIRGVIQCTPGTRAVLEPRVSSALLGIEVFDEMDICYTDIYRVWADIA